MEGGSFKCPVDEWYLARIYMELEHVEGRAKEMKREIIKRSVIPSLLVVLFLPLGLMKINTWNNISLLSLFTLSFIGLAWVFKLIKDYKNIDYVLLVPPSPYEANEIPLYEISNKGVKVNFYNDDEYSLFFRWGDFQYGQIEKMQIKPIYSSHEGGMNYGEMRRKLNSRYKKTKKLMPDFPHGKKTIHEDKRSITLLHQGASLYNILPIPPSWEKDERANQFIDLIQKGMKGNLLQEGEAWEIFDKFFPKISKFVKSDIERQRKGWY